MKMIESGIRDVEQGQNVKVVMPVNLYECKLGDDVFIGPFVEIQKGCVIGDRTRADKRRVCWQSRQAFEKSVSIALAYSQPELMLLRGGWMPAR